jgi:hypothetical protein
MAQFANPSSFRLPGGEHRTVVMGQTGTGKTVFAAWLLSKQDFEKRPWVALDFKDEELWDRVGETHMPYLRVGELPRKTGLYRMRLRSRDEDALEDWLGKVWKKGNIGIFADELTLIPKRGAFQDILRQGRSLRIPVIGCTQRPFDCDTEIFTESQFRVFFPPMDRKEDQKRAADYMGRADITQRLPKHESYWYDSPNQGLFRLKPSPSPDSIASALRSKAPRSLWLK